MKDSYTRWGPLRIIGLISLVVLPIYGLYRLIRWILE